MPLHGSFLPSENRPAKLDWIENAILDPNGPVQIGWTQFWHSLPSLTHITLGLSHSLIILSIYWSFRANFAIVSECHNNSRLPKIKSHNKWDQRVFKQSNPGKKDHADKSFSAYLDDDPGLIKVTGIVQARANIEMTGICADALLHPESRG